MPHALSFRDRASLVIRAIAGSLPTDPGTIGGKLLAGIIQSGGYPPQRNVRQLLDGYSHQPWLRAVVARISFDVAATEWQLYVKRRSGGKPGQPGKLCHPEGKAVRDAQVKMLQRMPYQLGPHKTRHDVIKDAVNAGDLTPIENNPFLDLLDNFNVFHTGLAARRVTQQHIDMVGEAFWLIERDGRGMPIALWPVPPHWILGTPTVSVPAFRVSFRGWQGSIPATEFVWFSDLDPVNPYARGSGTAVALGDDLETDEYATKHVKAFFFNRARPDLVVSPKADDTTGMGDDEVKRLEEGWTSRQQGFWRASKPFFLRRAVDIKELDQNLRAQQFVQLREFERETIIQVFGVSPEILGITDSSNRATVNMAEYIYGRRTLVPRLEFQRSVMQERLIPEFDERLILDYVSPVTKDSELELQAATTAPWALSIDEWRARMGENALETGGDQHVISPLLTTTDFSQPLVPAPAPALPGARPGAPELPLNPGEPISPKQLAAWDRFR